MTDPPTPPEQPRLPGEPRPPGSPSSQHPGDGPPEIDDESVRLVLAVLDGDATADERRRVARDPALAALVAAQRAAATAVAAAPGRPSDEQKSRARAAALAALAGPPGLDAVPTEPSEEPDDPALAPGPRLGVRPPPLSVANRDAHRHRRRLPGLPAVAAAVVLLVVLGVGLILNGQGVDQTASESRSADTEESTGAGGADAARAAPSTTAIEKSPAAPDAASGEGAVRPDQLPDLGGFADQAVLTRTLATVDVTTLAPPTTPSPPAADSLGSQAADRCEQVIRSADEMLGERLAAARAVLDGDTVIIISSPIAAQGGDPARTRLTVMDPTSCVPRFAVER